MIIRVKGLTIYYICYNKQKKRCKMIKKRREVAVHVVIAVLRVKKKVVKRKKQDLLVDR